MRTPLQFAPQTAPQNPGFLLRAAPQKAGFAGASVPRTLVRVLSGHELALIRQKPTAHIAKSSPHISETTHVLDFPSGHILWSMLPAEKPARARIFTDTERLRSRVSV